MRSPVDPPRRALLKEEDIPGADQGSGASVPVDHSRGVDIVVAASEMLACEDGVSSVERLIDAVF